MAKSTRGERVPSSLHGNGPRTVAIVGTDTELVRRLQRLLSADAAGEILVGDGRVGADLIVVATAAADEASIVGEVHREIEASGRVPLLIAAPRVTPRLRAAALEAGADDCVSRGVRGSELRARVRALLRRSACDRAASPLTGLPGNVQLEEDLKLCLANGISGALIAVDVRDFKPFNDRYGYARGDAVLQWLAHLLSETARDVSRETQRPGGPSVYHIGGDDFLVIAKPEQVEAIARAIVGNFDAQVTAFYDAEDLERGYLAGVDRLGRPTRFPLLALAIAAVTWEPGEATHMGELARNLAVIKEMMRKRKGSVMICQSSASMRS